MTYEELRAALDLFDLDEGATLGEIKRRHRELVKRYHPDHRSVEAAGGSSSPAGEHEPGPGQTAAPDAGDHHQELIRRINAGYRLILEYVTNYRFSFSREEFHRQNPDQRLRHQFGNDPLWGTGWK